ncbi:MAG TPA: protein YgfX [Gammaproteobacteria bacterium]|nr:protein YgfX [Gammaproteobacteria bacterium]
MLWVWWGLLHALLGAASVLVGWPVPLKVLAFAAVVGHGVLRRPAAAPRVVHFTADGCCAVPEWKTGSRPLAARTLVCPFWVRLDLGMGPWPRDILLIADQMRPDEWRRLRALLLRTSCE